MENSKLRRQIAWEAARLMYVRQESEYFRAKMKAARRICRGWVKPADLPSNAEIRDQILMQARLHEGDRRVDNLREMRIEGLRVMRILRAFRPRLIGSTLTGHVRAGSDIDIHVFSDSVEAVCGALDAEGMVYDLERKQVRKAGEEHVYKHIHVQERFPIELTIYAEKLCSYGFKSSITGKTIERASIAELEDFLAKEYPETSLDADEIEAHGRIDRFAMYEILLLPLEKVKQSPKWHPEGDALYHSLQVFDHARDALPYDEEFMLAALLHDIGKAIDPDRHVESALEALVDYVTPRTLWLVEHHMEAHQVCNGTIGARARRRLEQSEDFETLMLLSQCDRAGRQRGVATPDVQEALDFLRELAQQ
jgi:hypothetical protein